jgi:hypothetical protein
MCLRPYRFAPHSISAHLASLISRRAHLRTRAVFFACAVTIVLALQAVVWFRIQRVNDQRDVKYTPADLKDKNPMASMMGVDDKVEGDDVVTTVSTATYDAMECRKWVNATIMPMCICVGIHSYWGMLPPLVLMPLNQLMDAMNHSLTRYVFFSRLVFFCFCSPASLAPSKARTLAPLPTIPPPRISLPQHLHSRRLGAAQRRPQAPVPQAEGFHGPDRGRAKGRVGRAAAEREAQQGRQSRADSKEQVNGACARVDARRMRPSKNKTITLMMAPIRGVR